uniref:PHB/PHA accumulation regulator DNA-binding domain n=1 Tax=Siphoviridae sp. ctgaY24 TaxID=2827911 RepID=A0A8S5SB13_9CAUD|nr:MAG TPA: PHB/PHA accumulation regulator DNA-binding domain [Siphoviridae sp. ctgaY24]
MIQLFIYVILAKTHIKYANRRFYGYVNILN